jgi:uracil-DNA glycosylase
MGGFRTNVAGHSGKRQTEHRAPPRSAETFLPARRSVGALRAAAENCRGCDLYKHATQTVFGEGRSDARLLFVGEQPGNDEDLAGQPFVGPAGRLLDQALAAAGVERKSVYVTNVVKHFKWEPRGKRRLHKKPSSREVAACRPWFLAEVRAVRPSLIVCLGATAAQSLLGSAFRLTKNRGRRFPSELGPDVIATVHPSSVLRAPDDATRRRERERFFADIASIASSAPIRTTRSRTAARS